MTALRRAAALAHKDLLLEWRGREAITTMGSFAFLMVLLLGLAFEADRGAAPAVLWVALSLAAMLGTGRPAQREIEEQTLEPLLLYPGSRESLYWGKWTALVVLLAALLLLLLPLLGLLFNVDLWARIPAVFGAGLCAIVGLAAVGTLLAGLTLHVRGRELLMPLLLLPVSLPVILAGVRLTEAALAGRVWGLWLGVVAVFDILSLLLCPILFEVVMEET